MQVFLGAVGRSKDRFDALAELGLVKAACKQMSVHAVLVVWLAVQYLPIRKLVMDSLYMDHCSVLMLALSAL